LERSDDPKVSKLLENYLYHPIIQSIKSRLNLTFSGDLVSLCRFLHYITLWNSYVKRLYYNQTTLTTHTTYTTLTTLTTPELNEILSIFDKINESGITGRSLELWFPLFIISSLIRKDLLEDMIKIAVKLTSEQQDEEKTENRDILLIEFVSKQTETGFIEIQTLTKNFKDFLHENEDEEIKWLNTKWVGRALKRLNLIIQKKRLGKGREVILDLSKAKNNIMMFKPMNEQQDVQEVKEERIGGKNGME
jgi:hypothetical protein